jgi:hypothetical protein
MAGLMNKITFNADEHLYTNEFGIEVPSATQLLKEFGISNYDNVDGRVLDAAANFGTNVHQTTHLFDINNLEYCDPQIQPYLDQWIKFRKEYNVNGFQIIEEPLYSSTWGYAGMPDRVFNGILTDIKSGCKTVAHQIQTALYKILIEENYDFKIKERWVVYLQPDGYKVEKHKDRTDIQIAKSLAQLYQWKKLNKLPTTDDVYYKTYDWVTQ